jgi:hypothetical protein
MSTPLWINSGPCPAVTTVYGSLQQARPPRSGFMEFGSLSNPPNVYQECSLSGSPLHASWALHSVAGNPSSPVVGSGNNTLTPFSQIDVSWSNSTEFGYSGTGNDNTFNQVIGSTTTNTDNSYLWSDLDGPVRSSIPDVSAVASTGSASDVPRGNLTEPSGSDPAVLASSSQTDATITVAAASNKWLGSTLWQVAGATINLTLSSLDTDANALARAAFGAMGTEGGDSTDNYGFSGGFYSLYETRKNVGSLPGIRFGYQKGTYQIGCANLFPGLHYTVTVLWEQRTAAGRGDIFVSGDTSLYGSTWADADTDVFNFVADDVIHTTTSHNLPMAPGYQKRIKSIAIAAACL